MLLAASSLAASALVGPVSPAQASAALLPFGRVAMTNQHHNEHHHCRRSILLCAKRKGRSQVHIMMSGGASELSAMTLADVRATESGEDLDALITNLEAAASKAVEASEGAPDMHLSQLLAVAHTCAGDYELAAPHAQEALQSEGAADQPAEMRAEMFFVIGLEAERRGEEDEALDSYEKAVDLDPNCWRALFHVGKISLQFGWAADAADYFKQVAAIEPSHAPTKAFLKLLDESGSDLDFSADDDEDEDDESLPVIELPDLPPGIGDIKL